MKSHRTLLFKINFFVYSVPLYLASIIVLLFSLSVTAQDIHYALFMYSPLNLNPAKTGFFDGSYRIAANNRQQWNSVTVPYKTFSGSVDVAVDKLSGQRNRISAGLLFNSDKAGDSDFGTLDGELSVAWQHYLDNDSQQVVSGGVQAGAVQRSISYSKLTFDNQFNGDVFDPSISPGENFEVSRFYYFNLGAGAAWECRVTKKNTIGAEFSIQHINKPRQTFFDEKSVKLPLHFQFNINASVFLNDRITFLPDLNLMKQNTFSEFIAGGQFKFILSDRPGKQYALYLGLEDRIKDAVIPLIGIDYNALHFGVSYDVNTSGLKRASNGKGGLELALIYIIKKVKPSGIKPPCVIY